MKPARFTTRSRSGNNPGKRSRITKACTPTVGTLGDIDIETCTHCGGPAKVIADTSDRCIKDQQVIEKILAHLKKKNRLPSLPNALPETRAPPHQQ